MQDIIKNNKDSAQKTDLNEDTIERTMQAWSLKYPTGNNSHENWILLLDYRDPLDGRTALHFAFTVEMVLPETYFELLADVCSSPGEEEQQRCLEALLEHSEN